MVYWVGILKHQIIRMISNHALIFRIWINWKDISITFNSPRDGVIEILLFWMTPRGTANITCFALYMQSLENNINFQL